MDQGQAGLIVGMCRTWRMEGSGVVICRTWHRWLGDVQNLAYGSGVGGSRKEFWNHAHFKQPLFMHPSSQYFAGGGRERTVLVPPVATTDCGLVGGCSCCWFGVLSESAISFLPYPHPLFHTQLRASLLSKFSPSWMS